MKAELAVLLLLGAVPAQARSRAPKNIPDADAALASITSFPARPCAARGRVQFFRSGRKPKGFGTTVYALPDGRLRREVRDKGPRKPAAQVIVDDGRTQSVYLAKASLLWSGAVAREPSARTLSRLKAIYTVAVSTGGHVAKLATWRLNFFAPGGPLRRSFWVDRKTGLLLKTETYRYDGTLSRRERLVKLETPAAMDPALFVSAAPSGTAARPLIPPDPPVAGIAARFPRWAPLGFLPLEARAQDGGALIVYGDGEARFTVFEGPAGASSGLDERLGREVRLPDGMTARLLPAGDGAALVRRTGAGLLVVSGDLADEELARVAESLEEAR